MRSSSSWSASTPQVSDVLLDSPVSSSGSARQEAQKTAQLAKSSSTHSWHPALPSLRAVLAPQAYHWHCSVPQGGCSRASSSLPTWRARKQNCFVFSATSQWCRRRPSQARIISAMRHSAKHEKHRNAFSPISLTIQAIGRHVAVAFYYALCSDVSVFFLCLTQSHPIRPITTARHQSCGTSLMAALMP